MAPGVKVVEVSLVEVKAGLGLDLEEESDASLGDGGGVDWAE